MAFSFRKKKKEGIFALSKLYKRKSHPQRIFNYRQLTNLIIMGQIPSKQKPSGNKRQLPPYPLTEYEVSSSISVSLPNDRTEYESGDFISIPKEIILIIAGCLSRSDRGVLKLVSRYFLTILRFNWPPMPEYLVYCSDKEIKHLRELCRALLDVEITYNNVTSNSKMSPARYLAIRDQYPHSELKVNLSRLEGLMVNMAEFDKDDYPFDQFVWVDYMKFFENLVYMTITDAEFSYLDIRNLQKLEGFFAKFNLANGSGGVTFLPPNIKEIVLYAPKENYQEHHTQLEKGYLRTLGLRASKCTELEFW
jgi:hypothetical protein